MSPNFPLIFKLPVSLRDLETASTGSSDCYIKAVKIHHAKILVGYIKMHVLTFRLTRSYFSKNITFCQEILYTLLYSQSLTLIPATFCNQAQVCINASRRGFY